MRIAVIGPVQSGKTCLAIGLSSTNTTGFTIASVDDDVGKYLSGLKAGLVKGHWPDPDNKGFKKPLRFDFCKTGKDPIRVEFLAFSGEFLDSDEFKAFANENFKNLSGVVLLVNPGADAFQSGDPLLLADTMEQYKNVISFLRDPNNGSRDAFVALTVTAADRIDGDLAGKLEGFNQSIKELTNTLGTRGFRTRGFRKRCERFDVTVTGQLDNQDEPKVTKDSLNSASKPFLWLLGKLERKDRCSKLLKKIRNASIAAAAIGSLAAGWCVVDANNEKEQIDRFTKDCNAAVEACMAGSKPSDKNLLDACNALGKLRDSRYTWRKEYAAECVKELDSKVWEAHKSAINRAISDIAENPATNGSAAECTRIDDLFAKFKPTAANAKAEWKDRKQNWEVDEKPAYQQEYNKEQQRINISKPLEESQGKNGLDFINQASDIYSNLEDVPEGVAKKVDDRFALEWDFAIRDFGGKASARASHDAACAFVARLEKWAPATEGGKAEKAKLIESVSKSMPGWRTAYEEAQFSQKIEAAIKSGSLEKLAEVMPGCVQTNEFLTEKFVGEQWSERGSNAWNMVYSDWRGSLVAKACRDNSRPEITDEVTNEINNKVLRVNVLDGDKVLQDVKGCINLKAQEWDAAKRAECEKWVADKVRPGRRWADLWDEYEDEARRTRNPYFVEIAGVAVYRQVEIWFESYVDKFRNAIVPTKGGSIWDDGEKFAIQYSELIKTFDEFRKVCRHINKDKNPPAGTWAHRFAELCVEKGETEKGRNNAFPQRIVVRLVDAMIDYKHNFPVNYSGTAFSAWFDVSGFEDNCARSEKFSKQDYLFSDSTDTCIIKDQECERTNIWNGEKICEAGLFQRTVFHVSATDYNGNRIRRSGDIVLSDIVFADKQGSSEYKGEWAWTGRLHIGRWTGSSDADITVWISAEMSGETPFTLLDQAKRETQNSVR